MDKKEFEHKYQGTIPDGKLLKLGFEEAEKRGIDIGYDIDTTHDVSIVDDDGNRTKFGTFKHAHFAGYAEDLINAFHDGDLVWKGE